MNGRCPVGQIEGTGGSEAQHGYGHTETHDVGLVGGGGWGDRHVRLIFCLSNLIFGSVCCGYSTEEVASPWLSVSRSQVLG